MQHQDPQEHQRITRAAMRTAISTAIGVFVVVITYAIVTDNNFLKIALSIGGLIAATIITIVLKTD
ncbi:MAG: hypothetical protein ABEH43_06635 [Flavobacteriales bacterium]